MSCPCPSCARKRLLRDAAPSLIAEGNTVNDFNKDPRRLNTPAEMIEVLQAHAAGRAVQRRNPRDMRAAYVLAPRPGFNFALNQYRIAPPPLAERWAIVHDNADDNQFSWATEEAAKSVHKTQGYKGRVVCLREVTA